MKTAYIFNVKYLSATDTKGTRFKVTYNGANGAEHVETFPYQYDGFNAGKALEIATRFLRNEIGIKVTQRNAFTDETRNGFLIGFVL